MLQNFLQWVVINVEINDLQKDVKNLKIERVKERVKEVKDFLQEGQVVKVKLLAADERGRLKLSMKALTPEEGGPLPPVAQQAAVVSEAIVPDVSEQPPAEQ